MSFGLDRLLHAPGLHAVLSMMAIIVLVPVMFAKLKEGDIHNWQPSEDLQRRLLLLVWFGLIVTVQYRSLLSAAPFSRSFLLIHTSIFAGVAILVTVILIRKG